MFDRYSLLNELTTSEGSPGYLNRLKSLSPKIFLADLVRPFLRVFNQAVRPALAEKISRQKHKKHTYES
jgi:hypothetical protein